MGPSTQLANYFTTAGIHCVVTLVLVYTLFLSTQYRKELSPNAWWVLFGIMLDTMSWSIHQAWFGTRWFYLMESDPQAVWFLNNSWLLTPNYVLGWAGALIVTTAFLRSHFVPSLGLKVVAVLCWWALIYTKDVWS